MFDGRLIGQPTLLSRLAGAGYRNGHAGKWHLPREGDGALWGAHRWHTPGEWSGPLAQRGYDFARDEVQRLEWGGSAPFAGRSTLPAEQTQEAWTAHRAIEMVDAFGGSDDPFLVFASFFGPHFPYAVPEPWDGVAALERGPPYLARLAARDPRLLGLLQLRRRTDGPGAGSTGALRAARRHHRGGDRRSRRHVRQPPPVQQGLPHVRRDPPRAAADSSASAQNAIDADPAAAIRMLGVLLLRMARIHKVAVVRANQTSNLHSLAVQMRLFLEWAAHRARDSIVPE